MKNMNVEKLEYAKKIYKRISSIEQALLRIEEMKNVDDIKIGKANSQQFSLTIDGKIKNQVTDILYNEYSKVLELSKKEFEEL